MFLQTLHASWGVNPRLRTVGTGIPVRIVEKDGGWQIHSETSIIFAHSCEGILSETFQQLYKLLNFSQM